MLWDFAENNVFGESAGDYTVSLSNMNKALIKVPASITGRALQLNAQNQFLVQTIISTDPPYYDNICYADLSDFFYVWLRRSLHPIFPKLFSTLAVPKSEELVATPHRHADRKAAEIFFLEGMTEAMRRLVEQAHPAFPITIYYSFKASETTNDAGTTSTGWETFLSAVIKAGFALTGTWPMRTEMGTRMVGRDANALASSIVLVCRKRPENAPTTTRADFAATLKDELLKAVTELQRGNIAPVDLAQASIGPGMAVFTRYQSVLNADGTKLTVRDALALINQTLDDALAEQEGDFDADSRWALAWFSQQGFDEDAFGVAETLATAKNTSVAGLVEAGVAVARRGKVALLRPKELPDDWNPQTDARLTVWEMVHHLIRVLEKEGEAAAATLLSQIGANAETARELAYRLYNLCDRKKWADVALSYNALVQSWPALVQRAREFERNASTPEQTEFSGMTKE